MALRIVLLAPELSSTNAAWIKIDCTYEIGGENRNSMHLSPVQSSENFGCMTLCCETVEQSCSGKKGMVTRRSYACHHYSVDEAAGTFSTSLQEH